LCGPYGGKIKIYPGFWWGKVKERDDLKDLDVDIRMILKWLLNK
jgi:hypothetical protein